jgi:hypothetical protein
MNSKPKLNLFSVNNNQPIRGGYSYGANHVAPTRTMIGGADDEEHYRYKAKKYHYKCQAKLLDMKRQAQSRGQMWACPSGFEKYLNPF